MIFTHILGSWLVGAVNSSHSHGGLEKSTFKQDTALLELLVADRHNLLLHLCSGLNVMSSVNENLWLHNRNKASLLADTSVAAQSMCSFIDGIIRGAALLHINA